MTTPTDRRPLQAHRRVLAGFLAVLMLALGTVVAAPLAAADGHARIHLLHGIPDVDVDVVAGGEVAVADFSFGDTQDLSALAGATLEDLQVVVAGTDTVAIDAGDVALPSEGNFTVVAHLDADGAPALAVFDNDDSATAAGEGRLTVRHAAAAPAVDVLAGDAVAIANLANGEGRSLDLGAGTISASVVPTGASDPVVIGPADLTVTEGESLIVYAVGSLGDDSLTVLTETIDGLHSAPARVDTGNSPVDNPLGGLAVALVAAALVAVTMVPALRTRSVEA